MPSRNRIAIMQPYFLPYLGYWQLMSYVDTFVIYDDIQFTKKGWIHRNRYLNNGSDRIFTLPLRKDSDYSDVVKRSLSDSWDSEKSKLLRRIEGAYKKAPRFDDGMSIFNECLEFQGSNLFHFILNSIKVIRERLDIATELKISSSVGDTNDFKGQERVLEICKILNATEYVNPIGGRELYQSKAFETKGFDLKFHDIGEIKYDQMQKNFIPNLSVIDMIMHVGIKGVKEELSNFELKK